MVAGLPELDGDGRDSIRTSLDQKKKRTFPDE